MKYTVKKNMSEEMVFAQELSDDELETVSGGLCGLNGACYSPQAYEIEHCTYDNRRNIYEDGFPNCAATVESGSSCYSNDACYSWQVDYKGMVDCYKAWE